MVNSIDGSKFGSTIFIYSKLFADLETFKGGFRFMLRLINFQRIFPFMQAKIKLYPSLIYVSKLS